MRDARYKYILNLNAENEFANAVTARGDGYFDSWRQQAATNPFAREQVARFIKRLPVEFHDLAADPFEMTNLADRAGQRDKMAQLRAQLEAWMKQQGDLGVATEMDALNRQAKVLSKQRADASQRGAAPNRERRNP